MDYRLYLKNAFRHAGLKRIVPLAREKLNILVYKEHAPLYAERLWVNPLEINKSVRLGSQTSTSGKILRQKKLFDNCIPVKEDNIIKKCFDHWVYGKSWKETGIVDELLLLIGQYGSYDGCKSESDVVERYRALDSLFNTVSKARRLKPKNELSKNAFREEGGILIHIGPNGELFFGGNGNHRLAIALILEVESIPVQLGATYHGALQQLQNLRKPELT